MNQGVEQSRQTGCTSLILIKFLMSFNAITSADETVSLDELKLDA